MKLKKTDKIVLKYLFAEYSKRHGPSMAHLDDFSVFIINDGLKSVVPELYGKDPNLIELKAVFKELSHRGLIKILGKNRDIALTENGYMEASKTWWIKIIELLNTNPGLAILISLISLIVSVLALFRTVN
jgi:hypothetical protein